MGQAALQYDEFEDIEPIEVPAGGIASFLTATEGSWATNDEDDLPQTGIAQVKRVADQLATCLLYTSPSPRDGLLSRMPSSA